MPWIKGGTWVPFPWVDPGYKEKAMALGKGPAVWYLFNTWEVQVEQTDGQSFRVGKGTNAFVMPSYMESDDQHRVLEMHSIIRKTSARRQKIWSETEGLMADPLDQSYAAFVTYSGSWCTENDVRLRSREVEILGIIDANPGIKIKELALIYNTTSQNITRILMVAGAAGVKFSRLKNSQVRIFSYGIYDKDKIKLLHSKSDGLESIIRIAKSVFKDVSDARTGKVVIKRVKSELRDLWKAKLELEEQKQNRGEVICL